MGSFGSGARSNSVENGKTLNLLDCWRLKHLLPPGGGLYNSFALSLPAVHIPPERGDSRPGPRRYFFGTCVSSASVAVVLGGETAVAGGECAPAASTGLASVAVGDA